MFDLPSFTAGFITFPGLVYALAFALLTVEIAYDSGLIAALTLAVVGAVSLYFGWVSLGWDYTHWTTLALFAAIYIPVGVLWAIIKWYFFVHDRARALTDRIADAQRLAKQYKRDVVEAARNVSREPPQVRNHKIDITRWMGWWPCSMVGTLLNDPFRRLFEALYRMIGDLLQDMSDRAFAHLQLPPVEPPVERNGA